MFTRCFERQVIAGYEVINISDYGFEYYLNNRLLNEGLVENLDETIEFLKEDGWQEVL